MARITEFMTSDKDITYPAADDKARVAVDKEYAKAKRRKGSGRQKWYEYDA